MVGTLPNNVRPSAPVPPTPKLAPDPALLQIEGRWKGLAARYEFIRQNGGYRVTQFNLLGMKIGEGEAVVSDGLLAMTVRNKFTGPMTVDLQLSGKRLSGTMRGFIPLPVTLKRAQIKYRRDENLRKTPCNRI
jgi:hypothetical protein